MMIKDTNISVKEQLSIVVAEYGEISATLRHGYQLRIALLTALATGTIALLGIGFNQKSSVYVTISSILPAFMPLVEFITKIYLAPFVYRALKIEKEWFDNGIGVYSTYFCFRPKKWSEIQKSLLIPDAELSIKSFKQFYLQRHFWIKLLTYWIMAGAIAVIGLTCLP